MAADHSDRAGRVKAGAFDLSAIDPFAKLLPMTGFGALSMPVHPVPRFPAAPTPPDAVSTCEGRRLSALRAALTEGENSGPPEPFDVERFLLERRAAG
jgi:hypothetical protein